MVARVVQRRQAELGRSFARRDLPDRCDLQAVNATTGARTAVASAVPCRVVYPRSVEGGGWLGDQRAVRVLVPVKTAAAGVDLVVVAFGATYRVVGQDPVRADDLLRSLAAVEAREAGGAV